MQASRHRSSEPAQPGLLERALAAVDSAIFITDTHGQIVWANEAFSRLSGFPRQEVIGRTPSFLKSGHQDATFYRELWTTILAGKVWRGEVVERRKDGSLYTVDQVVTPLRDESGAVTHYVAVHNDITAHKQQGERERYLAYHDALTGLSNRTMFIEVLQQAIPNARRAGRALALLYIDIDKFKPINDSLGHAGGDRLLVAVAERLSAAVRKTDTVARLGGDEFAILQTNLVDTSVVNALARKLLQTVTSPFVLEGHKAYISVSIGIAIYPADAETADGLLRNADQAMYRAKHQGRGTFQWFREESPTLAFHPQTGAGGSAHSTPRRTSPKRH